MIWLEKVDEVQTSMYLLRANVFRNEFKNIIFDCSWRNITQTQKRRLYVRREKVDKIRLNSKPILF